MFCTAIFLILQSSDNITFDLDGEKLDLTRSVRAGEYLLRPTKTARDSMDTSMTYSPFMILRDQFLGRYP